MIKTIRHDGRFFLAIVQPVEPPGGQHAGIRQNVGVGVNLYSGETFSVVEHSQHKMKMKLEEWAKDTQ